MECEFNDYSLIEYFKILEEEFDIISNISNCSNKYEMVSILEELSLKEESIIDKFPFNIAVLEELSISVHNFYENDDEIKKYFVLMRFDNTLEVLKANVEDQTVSKDLLNDEFYDSYSVFNKSREYLLKDFISNDLSDFKYLTAFLSKDLSDELILNNFDFDSISSCEINKDKFYEFIFDEVQRQLMDIITLAEFDKSSVLRDYNIELFKFMLSKLRNYDFDMLLNDFENDKIYLNNISYFDILDILKEEEKKRSERNVSTHKVDMKSFDSIVDLIKLEEVLFNKYDSLDLDDSSIVNSISNLVKYEKEIVDGLFIDGMDCDILYDVISSDIDFFLVSNYSPYIKNLISRRIINLLPIFQNTSTFSKCYNEIVKMHIINSLNEYRSIICDVSSEEDAYNYIRVYKNIIFEYPDLLDDVIALDYNFSTLLSFDEETNSSILGFNNSINYFYDKDNQLYLLAKTIIDDISRILIDMENNPELVSLYEFKICEFNDIINNISMEHLYSLYDEIEEISNDDIKKILLRKIDVVHKY